MLSSSYPPGKKLALMTLMTSMMRTKVMVIEMKMVLVMVMLVFSILGKARGFRADAALCDSVPTRRSVASAC